MDILMSENLQFMKVMIVNINPNQVATFFISNQISVLPLWRHIEPPLMLTLLIKNVTYVLDKLRKLDNVGTQAEAIIARWSH